MSSKKKDALKKQNTTKGSVMLKVVKPSSKQEAAPSEPEPPTNENEKKKEESKKALKRKKNVKDIEKKMIEIEESNTNQLTEGVKKAAKKDQNIDNESVGNEVYDVQKKNPEFNNKFLIQRHYEQNAGNLHRNIYDKKLGPRNRFNNPDKSCDIFNQMHSGQPEFKSSHKENTEQKNTLLGQINERKNRDKNFLCRKPNYDQTRHRSQDNLANVVSSSEHDAFERKIENPKKFTTKDLLLNNKLKFIEENLVKNPLSYAEIIRQKSNEPTKPNGIQYPMTERPKNKSQKDIFHDQVDRLMAMDQIQHQKHIDFLKLQMLPEDKTRSKVQQRVAVTQKSDRDIKPYYTDPPKSVQPRHYLKDVYSASRNDYLNNRAKNGLHPTIEIQNNGQVNYECRNNHQIKKRNRPSFFNIEKVNNTSENRANIYNNYSKRTESPIGKFCRPYQSTRIRDEIYTRNSCDVQNCVKRSHKLNYEPQPLKTDVYKSQAPEVKPTLNYCYSGQNYDIINHQHMQRRDIRPNIPWNVTNMYPSTMDYKFKLAASAKENNSQY